MSHLEVLLGLKINYIFFNKRNTGNDQGTYVDYICFKGLIVILIYFNTVHFPIPYDIYCNIWSFQLTKNEKPTDGIEYYHHYIEEHIEIVAFRTIG